MAIDLLAILQKSLDRALFLYIFIRGVQSSGVRVSVINVHIRTLYKLWQKNRAVLILFRTAKRIKSENTFRIKLDELQLKLAPFCTVA